MIAMIGSVLLALAPPPGDAAVPGPTTTQASIIRSLPAMDPDAVVASCDDRAIVFSGKTLFNVSATGVATPVTQVAHPIAVFTGERTCRVIDSAIGVVDVTASLAGTTTAMTSGPLPDAVTCATQSSDGSVWFGVEGSNQIGMIASDGNVRYFEFPEDGAATGTLKSARLQVAPVLSAAPILTRDVQLISAAAGYVWALRESTPLNAVAYALRFDPTKLTYERLSLGQTARFAGLAALPDGRAAVLTLGDRVLMLNSSRIETQWDLPGRPIYHAPPFRLNMTSAVAEGVYVVAVKDGSVWFVPSRGGMLTAKGSFPNRPSWIYVQSGHLIGIDTEDSLFMSRPTP